jgi:hypothetical protein
MQASILEAADNHYRWIRSACRKGNWSFYSQIYSKLHEGNSQLEASFAWQGLLWGESFRIILCILLFNKQHP